MDDDRSRRIGEEIAKACKLCSKKKLASMTIGELVDEAALSMAIDMLKERDFEKVVRCKDCEHSFINDEHELKPLICGLTKMCGTTNPMWFCADGEKSTYVEAEDE